MDLDDQQAWRNGCRNLAELTAIFEAEMRRALESWDTADALTRFYGQELIKSTMPSPLAEMTKAMLDKLGEADDE